MSEYIIYNENYAGHRTLYCGLIVKETKSSILLDRKNIDLRGSGYRSRLSKKFDRYKKFNTKEEMQIEFDKYKTAEKERDNALRVYNAVLESILA